MNLVKKILIAHGDAKIRRRLVFILADAGYDLRACGTAEAAAETARNEWFDLALIDYELSGEGGFASVEALKKIQPTVPVFLLVSKIELSLVVQGIRLGVTDVFAHYGDQRPLIRQIHALLRPGVPAPAGEEVTPQELAEVEAALDRLAAPEAAADSAEPSPGLPAELLRGVKERAMLEGQVARLEAEKAALEAELKTLLSQMADAGHLEAEVNGIGTEREIIASAQAAIDEKARRLSETRAEMARERAALEDERRKLAAASTAVDDELAKERAEMETVRAGMHEEDERLREEAARLQHEATKLAQERRRWHEDLDLLREQETNLRAYEARLREIQAQLEADRVLWFSSRGTSSRSPFTDDTALKEAWQKLNRASELLEAERLNFRDEKLALVECEKQLKQREARMAEILAQVEERERLTATLQPAPAPASSAASTVKSLTRAPLEVAKSVFGRKTED